MDYGKAQCFVKSGEEDLSVHEFYDQGRIVAVVIVVVTNSSEKKR